MKQKKVIFCWLLCLSLFSCFEGRNESKHLDYFNRNRKDFDDLLAYIENKYEKHIESMSVRIVFIDCATDWVLSESYICDDSVINKMKKINVKEISFEKSSNIVYFRKQKARNYSVVYYRYEYDGTGEAMESPTIYYDPIDKHWSLLIDSNFP